MHAHTRAYSHSLTGSCVLFVHSRLHLFLPSRLTKACLSLGTLSLFWCVIMCSSTNTCSPYINQTTHNPLGWTGSLHSDSHTSLSKIHKSRRTLWLNLILYSGRVMRDFVTLAIIVSWSLYTHGRAPWSFAFSPWHTRTNAHSGEQCEVIGILRGVLWVTFPLCSGIEVSCRASGPIGTLRDWGR